ncbi:MAG: gliding motility-associated C-terminal domain-containing protein, partial [Bacteroidota bacterium]
KIKLFLVLILGCFCLHAQEVCDNGTDDDGDGLIDLNDTTDCACAIPPIVESLLPNPSFDIFNNDADCESNQVNGAPDATGQANCLGGWVRASNTTTDAWHLITLPGSSPFWPGDIPQPIPSGVGAAGFFIGVHQDISGPGGIPVPGEDYREYLGACFQDEGLIAGVEYRLNFFLGLTSDDLPSADSSMSSPLPVTLNVYGIENCDQIPYVGVRCPELAGAEGWELVDQITVTEGTLDSWEEITTTFVSPNNYEAFAIGGSCDDPVFNPVLPFWRNYYFIDELRLNRAEEFEQPTVGPIAVSADDICDPDAQMVAPETENATYQWYRNGVAIVGATSQTYWPPQDDDFNGSYTVRVTTDDGCGIAEAVDLIRPRITNAFADSVAWCPEVFSFTISPSGLGSVFNDAYTFLWDDGSMQPSRVISGPGTYEVTITAFCEEFIETIEVIEGIEPTYEIVIEPEVACFEDTVTVSFISNFYWQSVLLFDETTFEQFFGSRTFRLPINELVGTIRLIASNQCDVVDIPLDLPTGGLEFEVDISPPDCEIPLGTATVSTTATNANFEWVDENGDVVGSASELSAPSGTYQLTISTDDGCEAVDQVTIPALVNPLAVTAEIVEPNCFGTAGSIRVAPTSGGAYSYEWLNEENNPIGATDFLIITEAGTYTLILTRGNCSITESFFVGFDSGLEFEVQVIRERCGNDGFAGLTIAEPPANLLIEWFEIDSDIPLPGNESGRDDLPAGDYRVELTAVAGCTAVREFTIGPRIPIVISSEVTIDDCNAPSGATLTILASGGERPYEYQLDNGPVQLEQPIFTNLGEGTYEIRVTDVFGCEAVAQSPEIILPAPILVEAGPDLTVDLGDFVTISTSASGEDIDQATISWSPPDGLSCTNCPRPRATPFESTVYTISYTDPLGCVFADSVLVRVFPTGRVYIPNAFSPNFDGRNDVFELYTDQSVGQILELKVYDRWGGQRYAYDLAPTEFPTTQETPRWDGTCNGSPCPTGVYVYFAKVRLLNGRELDFSGDVMLVR